MKKIKVFIIDDHKLFIEGIYALLSDETSFEFVGNSMSPDDFLRRLSEIETDVFLMDIDMPEMSGINLTKMLLDKRPDSKVLALTMYDDFRHIEQMMKSGAMGYAVKSENITELIKAIKTVANGGKYISESSRETVVNRLGSIHELEEVDHVSKSKLTKREIEILLLIIREVPKKEIAEKLFISPRTLETHRKNIFAKANAKTVLGLLKYAYKEGLIEV
ncbi:MAG: response regulator transcription factor [Bacteroidales bacterium]|nr:response regulator transcription factor [Bacteroidales bacterium]